MAKLGNFCKRVGVIASTAFLLSMACLCSSWAQVEKDANEKEKIILDPPTLKIFPIDRRPLSECFKDDECIFYTLGILLDGRGNRVIYDQPNDEKTRVAGKVSEVTWDKGGENKITYTRPLQVINAMTPLQCVHEKECAWFAFYNSLFSAAYGERQEKKIHKRDVALEYWAEPKDQKIYLDELEHAYDRIRPYVSVPILKHNKFNAFLLFSHNLEQDALVNYRGFFAKMDQGTGINAIAFKKAFLVGQKGKTCANFPFIQGESNSVMVSISFIHTDEKYRSNCINKSVYASVGLSTLFDDFPFVITNQVEDEKDIPPSLTSLDLFLIYLLYQPEFKSGMPVDVKVLRPVFDDVYPRALKNFMNIYSKT